MLIRLFLLTLALVTAASAEIAMPGIKNSQLAPEAKGRALIEELNCAACHSAPQLESRRSAPRLNQIGARVNPTYIKRFIADPHGTEPGTTMPDLLANLPEAEREAVAESISHFLVSLDKSKGKGFAVQAPDAVAAEQGEKLFHSVGCVACHAPRDGNGKELLLETSIPLGALEEKYSFKSLSEFIRRPHAVRPSGRMPDLRLPGREIEQISHYLLRKTKVPGHLNFTTWRGKVWEGLDGDVEKERAGLAKQFSLESLGKKIGHQTAVRFSGHLQVKKAGEHRFFLELNGGGLSIDGKQVAAQEPSNRRGVKKVEGSVELEPGWHPIELTYFHTGRDPRLVFEMQAPGAERDAIAAELLTISPEPIPIVKPLTLKPELVATGRKHFESLGCANCHDDVRRESKPLEFPALAKLKPQSGCLSENPDTPRFNLSADQKKWVGLALGKIAQPLDERQKIDKTLVSLNCIACHDRKGLGGIAPERNAFFTGTKEALGDQGRLPPPLTHVGAKLTESWLKEVLMHGGRQRKYLNTRMPVYGEANVGHLVDGFAKVDRLEKLELPKITNMRESKSAGYEMMGTGGFSCIACHDYNGQESGAGALELIGVTDRVKKNWFHLYMRQPSRFHPTVIMPSYWPGGESIRKELLDGNTDQQIEALWAYLADGKRAKPPKGLSRQSPELRVADQTVMCRGRGTAGYRGIGVGYPERISLAFDSEEMALRLLWKGEFASVNHGSFRARGDSRIPFPAGIPFHRLKSMDDAWPYKGKEDFLFPQDHGYQYRGYVLDKEKRPTFQYQYGDIKVRDFFQDELEAEGKAYFKRNLTFEAPANQKPFYFRIASGKKIEQKSDGWQIDQLQIRLSNEFRAQVRDGDPQELLIPIELKKGTTKLQLEYRW